MDHGFSIPSALSIAVNAAAAASRACLGHPVNVFLNGDVNMSSHYPLLISSISNPVAVLSQ